MIVTSNGFTGVLQPPTSTDKLVNRELFPGYPVSTTDGWVITPAMLHQTGMAGLGDVQTQTHVSNRAGLVGLPTDLTQTLIAIVVIGALLYVFGRGK